MSKKSFVLLTIIVIGVILGAVFAIHWFEEKSSKGKVKRRSDGAIRVTDYPGAISCQNPVFSPDSCYIVFTKFKNGYNKEPSELVRVNIDGTGEKVIISTVDSDNVNVPGGSWVGNKICFASDRKGASEEIYTARDDGSNIRQITSHPEGKCYVEPVFNPRNANQIIFEYVPSDNSSHHIAIVEVDKGGRIALLTKDSKYDDRLPSWSKSGQEILFQRAETGKDNWQIYTAKINLEPKPTLNNLKKVSQASSHDTDNCWAYDDSYVLSSSDYGNIPVTNIYAFPVSGAAKPVRITTSRNFEDGAPAYSPDGKWIAFESHQGEDEDTPSEIWIIPAPKL